MFPCSSNQTPQKNHDQNIQKNKTQQTKQKNPSHDKSKSFNLEP